MRKAEFDYANRLAVADHPEAADLPPLKWPSLKFGFAREHKMKGRKFYV
jgi:hypothetical protein